MAAFMQALRELIAANRQPDNQEARARARLTPRPARRERRARKNNTNSPANAMPSSTPRYTVVTQPHQRPNPRHFAQTFLCTSCNKTNRGNGIECGSPSTRFCASCFIRIIVPLFQRALKNDDLRPVVVAGNALDIENFGHVIEMPFPLIMDWRERENQRRQPMPLKAYCKKELRGDKGRCGNFLGLRTKVKRMAGCPACRTLVCSCCAHVMLVNGSIAAHLCKRDDDFAEEPVIGKSREEDQTEGGDLLELGDSDPVGAGKLTKKERKERLWAWLDGVEEWNDGRPLD